MNRLLVSSLKTLLIVVLCMIVGGCGIGPAPRLTVEDRKADIEYMAKWARDYSPLVKHAEKYIKHPGYEELLPRYLDYAEQAQSNEDFSWVARAYGSVICPKGHRYLVDDSLLKWCSLGTFFGIIDLDISPFAVDKALYWTRLTSGIPGSAHPPFDIVRKEDKYFTNSDWQADGIVVPRGSQITKVNGMSCSDYQDFLKKDTFLRYFMTPNEALIKEKLLIVNESADFTGWQIDFLLPDGSTRNAFVPKLKIRPAIKIRDIERRKNCTCIELTDKVAYIRIRTMAPNILGQVFTGFYRQDGKTIKRFLNRAGGKYHKLIIDVRNNEGGSPYYVYENLIRPFLNEPATYQQVAGIRRKYRDDLKPSVLKTLRRWCSSKREYVVNTEQVDAPDGFDGDEWVFYRVTRRIEPRDRYNFDGSLYILINGLTFSAADDYANAVKRIGFAKLVGRNTGGGCGAYIGPPAIRLPASGMIFRVETEIVINPDGTINELFGTPPDVVLPPAGLPKSFTNEELLKDKWIKYIINKM